MSQGQLSEEQEKKRRREEDRQSLSNSQLNTSQLQPGKGSDEHLTGSAKKQKQKPGKQQRPRMGAQKIQELCPEIKLNWRDYFDRDELNQNLRLIENGIDPNEREKDSDGSDSEPEADLFQNAESQRDRKSRLESEKQKKARENKSEPKPQWKPSTGPSLRQAQATHPQKPAKRVRQISVSSGEPAQQQIQSLGIRSVNYQKRQSEQPVQSVPAPRKQEYPINKVGYQFQYASENN